SLRTRGYLNRMISIQSRVICAARTRSQSLQPDPSVVPPSIGSKVPIEKSWVRGVAALMKEKLGSDRHRSGPCPKPSGCKRRWIPASRPAYGAPKRSWMMSLTGILCVEFERSADDGGGVSNEPQKKKSRSQRVDFRRNRQKPRRRKQWSNPEPDD